MERKTEHRTQKWKGAAGASGLYRIDYPEPMTVREIFQIGPASLIARVMLFAVVFGLAGFLFSLNVYGVLDFIKGKDLLLLFLGIFILAGSFVLGKKVGRPFALILKWVGMPALFLGVYGVVLVRFGFAAFLLGPVDLFVGTTCQTLLDSNTAGYAAFHGLLRLLLGIKGLFLKEGSSASVLMVLVQVYREMGAEVNYYVVVPVLILISLALFVGTVLLIEVCAWLTMLIPAAACYGASRLLRMLDEKFL